MDPFVGEIRAVGFNFAPTDWALCDGSLVFINQNTALFSILGILYGGDGRATFGLPDLRGRAIVNAGPSPALTNYPIGTKVGTETVTVDMAQMPAHTHSFDGQFNVSSSNGSVSKPGGNFLGVSTQPQYAEGADAGAMSNSMISGMGNAAGGNQSHENCQPYLALNYIIALRGEYPQRP